MYNFNSVQLTFNQCVFNRIQYRTEHNLYSNGRWIISCTPCDQKYLIFELIVLIYINL